MPQLAQILKQEFGATRVAVFGSLTCRERYTKWSDIDLAAWDIPPDRFLAAVAAVTDISEEFEVDLIDSEDCSPQLQQTLEQEGIEV